MNRYAKAAAGAPIAIGCIVTAARVNAASGIDVNNETVTCDTFKGTIKYKPPLTSGGTTATQVKVKGVLAGCDTSAVGVSILPSKIKGTLSLATNACSFGGALPGTLTVKWKTDTAIVPNSSTIAVNSYSPNLYTAPWGGQHFQYTFTLGGVTGAFTGGDAGATSSATLILSDDLDAIADACFPGAGGVKAVAIGLGQVVLQ